MTDVRRGTLDYTLTKPADAQFLISISQFRIWKATDFVLGVIVLSYALYKKGMDVGVADAATFGLVLLSGAATIYSFFLILSTISFWYIKVENILNIFDAMVQAGRWPDRHLSPLAPLRIDVHRSRRVCNHGSRPGPDRPA